MWIRKAAHELADADRRRRWSTRFNPEFPLLLGVGVFAVATLIPLLYCSVSGYGVDSYDYAFVGAVVGIFLAAGIATVAYAIRIIGWSLWFRGGRSKRGMCHRCAKVREGKPGSTCECGGQLESLDNWKWVEDPASDSELE